LENFHELSYFHHLEIFSTFHYEPKFWGAFFHRKSKVIKFDKICKVWATFWATFSRKHLVALAEAAAALPFVL
jgi:hypothetical protein